jgi:hypothetical protein
MQRCLACGFLDKLTKEIQDELFGARYGVQDSFLKPLSTYRALRVLELFNVLAKLSRIGPNWSDANSMRTEKPLSYVQYLV